MKKSSPEQPRTKTCCRALQRRHFLNLTAEGKNRTNRTKSGAARTAGLNLKAVCQQSNHPREETAVRVAMLPTCGRFCSESASSELACALGQLSEPKLLAINL